ncbi:winged helix-turn-helix transcriptional regulator [Bacillus sp. V3B]|uniref:winged helix-turn-helix transcriptional regulator n=1 Tax=Bacillus sp. V3B TaxID=2804915 RepID=UPI00210E62F5|nr:winged helix-turn-helix transcriptional regulator [Bacillus sp. V3B]MCQ6277517.1 winged helix-turn-helix transcriptional regulator [Bacillus sp. V3B]
MSQTKTDFDILDDVIDMHVELKTSDIAENLKMPESTVRKYVTLLEKEGYELIRNDLDHRIYTKQDQQAISQMLKLKKDKKVGPEAAAAIIASHYRKATQNVSEVISYGTSTQDKSERHELSVVAEQIRTVQTQVEGLMNKEQGQAILNALERIASSSEESHQEMQKMRRDYEVMKEKIDIVNNFIQKQAESRNEESKKKKSVMDRLFGR